MPPIGTIFETIFAKYRRCEIPKQSRWLFIGGSAVCFISILATHNGLFSCAMGGILDGSVLAVVATTASLVIRKLQLTKVKLSRVNIAVVVIGLVVALLMIPLFDRKSNSPSTASSDKTITSNFLNQPQTTYDGKAIKDSPKIPTAISTYYIAPDAVVSWKAL